MGLWVRVLRGLALAGFGPRGVFVGLCAASLATAGHAVAQSASSIVVEGNRRVESDTIRSYFRLRPGERLDAVKIDEGLKALFATGLFQDVRPTVAAAALIITVVENPVINRVAVRGQQARQGRAAPAGDPVEAARHAVAADGAGRRPAHRRNLPAQRPLRRPRRRRRSSTCRTTASISCSRSPKAARPRSRTSIFVGNRAYSDWRLKDVIRTGESNILSFLKNNDLYDPDRVEADRDLLRRLYLKNGYADVRIVSAVAEYDPARKGFILTFTIEEGERYRFGAVDIQSNVRDVDLGVLRSKLRVVSPGGTYNAEAVEKSVEDMTIEMSKRGYAFAQVRPRGDRNFQTRTIAVVFVVEEGARAYVERINMRGNTRTRDYVIRREFDLAEGDAYNRVLVDRAERRLKNLGYFKNVKITTEPGSAPDRIIINVDVEEQSTGEFSIAGGYSTADGLVGEVSVGERNLLGRGQYARAAVTYGQRTRGIDLSFTEPYFLDYRLAFGIDLFAKQIDSSSYYVYKQETIGGGLRFGIPLREDLGLQLRYSVYRQKIDLDQILRNCNNINPNFGLDPGRPRDLSDLGALNSTPATTPPAGYTGLQQLLRRRRSLRRDQAAGRGRPGDRFAGRLRPRLQHARQQQEPDARRARRAAPGLRRRRRRRELHPHHRRRALYYELMSDIVSVLRVQAGHVTGWGSKDLRMLDHFQMGPNLVRGFQTAGIGPRDLTPGTIAGCARRHDVLGHVVRGAGAGVRRSEGLRHRVRGLRRRRLGVGLSAGRPSSRNGRRRHDDRSGHRKNTNDMTVRSSVGAGIIWDSPFGPIRVDYAFPLTKDPNDRVQELRFSGGTKVLV